MGSQRSLPSHPSRSLQRCRSVALEALRSRFLRGAALFARVAFPALQLASAQAALEALRQRSRRSGNARGVRAALEAFGQRFTCSAAALEALATLHHGSAAARQRLRCGVGRSRSALLKRNGAHYHAEREALRPAQQSRRNGNARPGMSRGDVAVTFPSITSSCSAFREAGGPPHPVIHMVATGLSSSVRSKRRKPSSQRKGHPLSYSKKRASFSSDDRVPASLSSGRMPGACQAARAAGTNPGWKRCLDFDAAPCSR